MAEIKSKKAAKKEKRKAAFGWDVFNQDSLYKGYKKRLVSLPTSEKTAAAVASTGEDALGDELAYGKDDKVEEVCALSCLPVDWCTAANTLCIIRDTGKCGADGARA